MQRGAIARVGAPSSIITSGTNAVREGAVISLFRDEAPAAEPIISNTCYSFVSDTEAMHVANVYRYDAQQHEMLTMEGGGVSDQANRQEALYAQGWAENIWADMFG